MRSKSRLDDREYAPLEAVAITPHRAWSGSLPGPEGQTHKLARPEGMPSFLDMRRATPNFEAERIAREEGYSRVAGVDEAGRGPLAGPVVAAAVILNENDIPAGLDDSKRLTSLRRNELTSRLLKCAEIGVGIATVEEIDQINILQASHLAMIRALDALPQAAEIALIDGNLIPKTLRLAARSIIKGDALSLSIAAASIVAKTMRDRIMVDLAQQHPGYGWEQNAAYPTKAHLQAIRDLGVTPHHRRSFKPVHNILCRDNSVTS